MGRVCWNIQALGLKTSARTEDAKRDMEGVWQRINKTVSRAAEILWAVESSECQDRLSPM